MKFDKYYGEFSKDYNVNIVKCCDVKIAETVNEITNYIKELYFNDENFELLRYATRHIHKKYNFSCSLERVLDENGICSVYKLGGGNKDPYIYIGVDEDILFADASLSAAQIEKILDHSKNILHETLNFISLYKIYETEMTVKQMRDFITKFPNIMITHTFFRDGYIYSKDSKIVLDENGEIFETWNRTNDSNGLRSRTEGCWKSGWKVKGILKESTFS